MKRKREKYLVTGSTGFIGANLVRALVAKGEDVYVVIRNGANTWRLNGVLEQINVHRGNVNDFGEINRIVGKIKPTVIYHLATYGAYAKQNDPDLIIETNIMGTWNLLKACALVGYKLFVNVGSSSEYGFKTKPMRETDLLEPNSYYAVTKAAQTHLCQYLAKQESYPIVTLRPFSIYGPYEEPDRLIPTMMIAYRENKLLNMVDRKVARDFLYVEDFVDVCLQINKLMIHKGECFNIGSGKQTSLADLVKTFEELLNKSNEVIWGGMSNRKWDSNKWRGNIKKANLLLGWKPKYTLRRGLKKTWRWFKSNSELYN